jgi:NAD(P)-dependent dehydrogenase (short-subunit alcohol dehydrogenase family)
MSTILLTGASRGLGRALGEEALAAGRHAVLTARSSEALADLVAKYPDTAMALPLDVTDAAARDAIDRTVDRFGPPDVVITNAGYADIVSIEDAELAEIPAVMETNLWGVVHVVKRPPRARARPWRLCHGRVRGRGLPRSRRPRGLHLPLSGEAFDHIFAAEQRRLAELTEWEPFARSV